MILYHPLNKANDANKKAIAKFKDRKVKVYQESIKKWLAINDEFICDVKSMAKELTFKQALKLTKRCAQKLGIQYHFIDGFGDEKPKISDFDIEDATNCPTVKYDEYKGTTAVNLSSTR